ncbi:hypothetical protein QE394_000993 [Arthrobacter sp. SORGH_AS 212]|uniref:zinc finger domain-containing protein n=1 Tax=Pseudarthrobacter sp. SORGH_AS 212 TaxID=3041777 RepID=UPI002789068A|nr:hypothetical protein [Arthrobacter sp. SORGH_AS_0212]
MTIDGQQGKPYDAFDPTGEGVEPSALRDVTDAAAAVHAALSAYRATLLGCRMPLNLKAQMDAADIFAEHLEAAVPELEKARLAIEDDVLLAPRFEPTGPKWFGPGKEHESAAILSPKQVVYLSVLADRDQVQASVTYRQAMEQEPDAVPALIARRRDAEKMLRDKANQATRRENYWILVEEVLEDIKSRPCPYCHAEAGKLCVSSSGAVCDPHTGRITASPIAGENPGVKKSLRWSETPEEWRARTGRPEPASSEQRKANKDLLRDVLSEMSEMTRPRY